ncbi:ABC transporter ATP-binding protein [Clostridium ganghwense]|uniref:ABC transporter ATP-binding protein n=1 Tax=Clostridium ganghwense TaxID=312089 RepID=A0ABT4CNV3_9CLOT|nr:ABC transporter ATP-binding protein [Clostridium ganghwense]MCY6370727.1 ABC transporter ATP-binding protein [Clostridium ganghwense]
MLKIKNLDVYIGKKQILHSINLEFEKGKMYGIIGPNGAGKSTLLSAVTKLIEINKGCIFLEGKDIQLYKWRELAQKIALMSQNFDVKFPYTVEQIVAMGRYPFNNGVLNDEDKRIIEKSMKDADIFPMRYSKITELSGGERQRVQFAKTLCQSTEIILIDEGFSNMDIYYQVKFIKLLKEKAKNENKMIIFIMHDLSMARKHCDEILILKEGTVNKFGKSEEVLNEKTLFEVFKVKGRFIHNSLELE